MIAHGFLLFSYFSSFFSGWVKGFSDVYNERKTDGCTFSIVKQPDPRAFSPATSFLEQKTRLFLVMKRFQTGSGLIVVIIQRSSEVSFVNRRFTLLRLLMD